MPRTGAFAGLVAAALLGVTPVSASAVADAAGPAVVTDGVHLAGTPRLAAPTVTAADQTVAFEAALTVPVQVTASGVTPTGTVKITEGGTVLGSAAVTAGTATVALPRTLVVGAHTLTASYSGDGSVSAGESSFVLTVVKAEVSMSIDKEHTYGSGPVQVFVTAPSVPDPQFPGTGPNGAPPGGKVTLREGKRVLGTESVGRVTSSMAASNYGVARIDVPAHRLPAGVHALTATFSGSAYFNGAEVKQKLTVTKAVSTTTAKLRPAQPRRGTPVRVKLRVKTETGKAVKGRVVVKVDGRVVVARLRQGKANVRLGTLSRGQHIARVVYRGNASVAASRTKVTITVP